MPHFITCVSQCEGTISGLNMNFLEAAGKRSAIYTKDSNHSRDVSASFAYMCLFLSLGLPRHGALFFPEMRSYLVEAIITHLISVLKPTRAQNSGINSKLLFYLGPVSLISQLFPAPVPNPPQCSSM